MSFVHLHVHSEYSLLDGFSNIQKLIARAKALNMPAVALTDHGTMFGAIDFYNTAKAQGVKPIIGVESYLAARGMSSRDPQLDKKSTHLLLLAENDIGYRNLLQIASIAQTEGFYYYPRVDHEFLAAHAEGLICTSGCMSAEVPRLLSQGNEEAARKQLDWYYEVFGPERFYLELQAHDIPELEQINRNLITLGRRYDARFVATNDVHYINKEDARLQDIMLAIQTGCLLSDPNRMRMTDNSYYLRTPEEMSDLFAEVPDAISNTLAIAERCNVDLGFKGYRLPEFPTPPEHTAQTYLRSLCEEGFARRYGPKAHSPVHRERLDYELGVIHQMGFDTYFLIVWDLCRFARQEGIWYNARGSAAGSMVAYTLDITLVDPIEHGLIFERFLNPGRVSMPDIDLDFRDDLRAKMLEYTAHKYGDDKVAQIITFGTLGPRAAIRDVARVMDIPLNEVNQVAKLVPNIPGKPTSIPEVLKESTEFRKLVESSPRLRELVDTAAQVEGVVRNAGTHAAGVIITDRPIIEYVPLHRPTGHAEETPIKTVTQFEMKIVDALGLLKVDFLGLSTLTIMARACDLIRERYGIELTLNNIPIDDPATFELLGRGETAGVFQVEGSGMRRWLVQMKPTELAHVIAMVALFRPGPMDFIPSYIRRMHGEEDVNYLHPELEPLFRETYGFPVYQEQLMFAAMALADYTASEADDLRKAIAKKMKDKLEKHRQKFTAGAIKHGIEAEVAAAIFKEWEEFARYGFNKAHAADYGVISVQTAYLKAHYPVEYMTALLSVTKNDSAKVAVYVADARRMGIAVKAPDINVSEWDFSIEDAVSEAGTETVIRFGMGAIKNVGQNSIEVLLAGREAGPFHSLNELARRVDLRAVGKRPLECLIKVGALDSLGERAALLEALDRLVALSSAHFRAKEAGQMSMFGAATGVVDTLTLPPASKTYTSRELLNWERELLGLYVSDHPLSAMMQDIEDAITHHSGDLGEALQDARVRVAGLIVTVRHHQSKAGKPMGFVTIEDIAGRIELVVFPRTWEKYQPLLEEGRIVLVEGRVDASGSDPKILADSISTEFNVTAPLSYDPPPSYASFEPDPFMEPDAPSLPLRPMAPPVAPVVAEAPPSYSSPSAIPIPVAAPEVAASVPDMIVSAPPSVSEPLASEPLASEPLVSEPLVSELLVSEPLVTEPLVSEPLVTEPRADAYSDAGPDLWPPDWADELAPEEAEAEVAAPSAARRDRTPPERPAPARAAPSIPAPAASGSAPNTAPSTAAPSPVATPIPPPTAAPFLVAPRSSAESQISMLTIVLRSTGDKIRDVLRLRRIHAIITSYPGEDRFAFQVFEGGKGYRLEFPNFSIGINNDMIGRVAQLIGQENILREPITFQ